MISKYTQAKAKFEKKVGGVVEYYDGAIKGKVEESEPNKKIILTWLPSNRKQSAHVQMTFKPKDGNEAQITILIKDCPNRNASGQSIEKEQLKKDLNNKYLIKLKCLCITQWIEMMIILILTKIFK